MWRWTWRADKVWQRKPDSINISDLLYDYDNVSQELQTGFCGHRYKQSTGDCSLIPRPSMLPPVLKAWVWGYGDCKESNYWVFIGNCCYLVWRSYYDWPITCNSIHLSGYICYHMYLPWLHWDTTYWNMYTAWEQHFTYCTISFQQCSTDNPKV